MTDAIKKGIYKNAIVTPSILRKGAMTTQVKLDSGAYVDIINPEYIIRLEQQLLELKKQFDIQEQKLSRAEAQLSRHSAAIRKLDK